MLKQTVQFTDFDGVNKTKVLYFNLTRVEVIDNLDIQREFQDVQDMIGGQTRDLEMHEIRLILNLVKKLMQMSYGVQRQTQDGDLKFTKKDPNIWQDFTETAVYDAFLMGLFEDVEKAGSFLYGIWPKELLDNVDVELPGMPVPQNGQPLKVAPNPDEDEQGEYTREALLAMPKEQFDRIVGTDPLKMSPEHLQLAFYRKNHHGE